MVQEKKGGKSTGLELCKTYALEELRGRASSPALKDHTSHSQYLNINSSDLKPGISISLCMRPICCNKRCFVPAMLFFLLQRSSAQLTL